MDSIDHLLTISNKTYLALKQSLVTSSERIEAIIQSVIDPRTKQLFSSQNTKIIKINTKISIGKDHH